MLILFVFGIKYQSCQIIPKWRRRAEESSFAHLPDPAGAGNWSCECFMLVTKQKYFLIAQKYLCLFFFLTPISATLSCPAGDLKKGTHNAEQQHFPFLSAPRRWSRKQWSGTLLPALNEATFSWAGSRSLLKEALISWNLWQALFLSNTPFKLPDVAHGKVFQLFLWTSTAFSEPPPPLYCTHSVVAA